MESVAAIGIPDVLVTLEGGTHFLVQPVSSGGREWIEGNVWPDYSDIYDGEEYHGQSLVVNREKLFEVFDGLTDDGLVVR